MNMRLAPRSGGLLVATAVLGISIGTGAAVAAPSGSNNGRHVGQSPSAAPTPHGATVRSAKASAKATAQATKATQKQQKSVQKSAEKSAHAAAVASAKTSHAAGPRATGSAGDPPGNNGTVKIADLGDLDRIPNNSPHPGCAFEVQWYGFDAGSDVISTVSFTPQAPTSDVAISVDGPTSVPVGEDAASGAGTATGLDAVVVYRLGFSGGAPAAQGYHVRLTVATPRSLGNDTKTKVFWVEPCDVASPAAAPAVPLATPAAILGPPPRPQAPSTPVTTPSATPAAFVAPPSPDRVGAPSPGVPTVIDAGQRHSLLHRVATTPWGLGLIALGAMLAILGAVVARRRA